MDVKSSFGIIITSLKVIGLCPPSTPNIALRFLYGFYTSCIFIITIFQTIAGAVYIIENIDDLEDILQCLNVLLVQLFCAPKSYILWKYSEFIRQVIDEFDEEDYEFKSTNQRDIMIRTMTLWRKLYFLLLPFSLVTVTFFLSLPLFKNDRSLPFKATYFFAINQDNYSFMYLLQIVAINYMSARNVVIDLFCTGLMAILGIQCEFLEDTMKNLDKIYGDNRMDEGLIECIEHHKKIIMMSRKVNFLVQWPAFFYFVMGLSTFSSNLAMMRIVGPKSGTFITLFNYQLLMMSLLYIYCWFGNEVFQKSSNLSEAAVSCNWVNCSQNFKKSLILFTMRSQRPIVIYILKMFTLSLNTYLQILKMSYSYYTLLQVGLEHE